MLSRIRWLTFGLCLGIAPPSIHAQSFLQQLQGTLRDGLNRAMSDDAASEPAAGRGVTLGLVADEAAPGTTGVEVLRVHAGSAADRAGIRVGDRIVAIDNQRVQTLDDLAKTLKNLSPESTAVVKVNRDGRIEQLNISFASSRDAVPDEVAPSAPRSAFDAEPLPPPQQLPAPAPSAKPRLGATVDHPSTARRYGLSTTVREGALVTAVTPGSAADLAGVHAGAVIVAFNGRRIDAPPALIEEVGKTRAGQQVEVTCWLDGQWQRLTVQMGADESAPSTPPPVPVPVPTPIDPSANGNVRERAPILGRVERLVEGILNEQRVDIGPSPPTGSAATQDRMNNMAAEIERLQQKILELETRLQALEQAP